MIVALTAPPDCTGEGCPEAWWMAAMRAKVEHPFLYVKRHFGYATVRYRGLAKNRNRLCLLLGLANLWLAERAAPASAGVVRP